MSKPGDRRRQPMDGWCLVCRGRGASRVAVKREGDYRWACASYEVFKKSKGLGTFSESDLIWHNESPAKELEGEYSL